MGPWKAFRERYLSRAQRLSDAFLYLESGPLLQLSIPVGRNTHLPSFLQILSLIYEETWERRIGSAVWNLKCLVGPRELRHVPFP